MYIVVSNCNAFVHRGPVIWNALPQYIKNSLTRYTHTHTHTHQLMSYELVYTSYIPV